MAFLKYRREVVQAWPESPRKVVFLAAIESRIGVLQWQTAIASRSLVRTALIGTRCSGLAHAGAR